MLDHGTLHGVTTLNASRRSGGLGMSRRTPGLFKSSRKVLGAGAVELPSRPMSGEAAALARLLRRAGRAVVFTGAGMSTESGLPDFRSAGGLWRANRRFEELASRQALASSYPEFVEFYRWRMQMLGEHAPHVGHRVLAD